jgi:hypothetical protein
MASDNAGTGAPGARAASAASVPLYLRPYSPGPGQNSLQWQGSPVRQIGTHNRRMGEIDFDLVEPTGVERCMNED